MGRLSQMQLIKDYLCLFPQVRRELRRWAEVAEDLPQPLRDQALASIRDKEFHCLGGAVYALYPGAKTPVVLRAIVAMQTISDYLDNLCDRLGVTHEAAFRTLHESFLNALQPYGPTRSYYRHYPFAEEGYLPALVRTCQNSLRELPAYRFYQRTVLYLGRQYCELQVRKHAGTGREKLLQEWINRAFPRNLPWQEWAAASGSTLGIFFCFALASKPPLVTEQEILHAYFPWIQGLHILLDYLIDRREDKTHGDLNFTFYYPCRDALTEALVKFTDESRRRSLVLPHPHFHLTVIDGLLALYGSDPKVKSQGLQDIFQTLARNSRAEHLRKACQALRSLGIL